MKAVRINEWGQPVQIEDLPQPSVGNDDVLVRVRAASVNPADGAIAAGYMKMMYSTPLTLGTDFSGEVVATGKDVQNVKPGDAVYGMSMARGTFAEYAVVKANEVARKPQSIDDVQAAAVPLTGLSAWQTLFNLARLQSGERVLILGAAGGIGSIAVQLAKAQGAYVIGLDRGDKAAFVQSLGADEFIDGSSQRFEDVAGAVDVVLDLVGGDMVDRSLVFLKPGGRYVTTAAMLSPDAGKDQGVVAMGTFTQPNAEELTKLAEAIDQGKVKVFIAGTYPLEDAQTALYAKPQQPGKVVITVQ